MAFTKQFTHKSPYKQVRCVRNDNVKFLRIQHVYDVINETPTQYQIKFSSKGTKWYDKSRFVDHGPSVKSRVLNFLQTIQPKTQSQPESNKPKTNQLF